MQKLTRPLRPLLACLLLACLSKAARSETADSLLIRGRDTSFVLTKEEYAQLIGQIRALQIRSETAEEAAAEFFRTKEENKQLAADLNDCRNCRHRLLFCRCRRRKHH